MALKFPKPAHPPSPSSYLAAESRVWHTCPAELKLGPMWTQCLGWQVRAHEQPPKRTYHKPCTLNMSMVHLFFYNPHHPFIPVTLLCTELHFDDDWCLSCVNSGSHHIHSYVYRLSNLNQPANVHHTFVLSHNVMVIYMLTTGTSLQGGIGQ